MHRIPVIVFAAAACLAWALDWPRAADVNLGYQSAPRRYPAVVRRVIDGDTLVADVDLGFRTIREDVHVRLLGIDAPEKNTTNGVKAKEHLAELVKDWDRDKSEEGWQVELVLESDETDSFGRTLAKVLGRNGVDLGAKMLADGFAEEYTPRK